jgi:predicted TIM-barrel fold metal-dependent hydrolase
MNSLKKPSRRDFLLQAGGVVASTTLAPTMRSMAADADEASLIIDCHAHIYSEDEKKYPIIDKPYRPPTSKGTIAHLRETLKANGVRYATAIHTSTFYKWDNRFTADASRDNRDIIVGVCTLNPDDPASPALLEKYVREFNVRGMRSIPAASGKLDDPGVAALWAMAEKLGIVINVLVNRDKRAEIEALCARHQKLRVVIDHCLNLQAGQGMLATLAAMIALAKIPTLHAKLSFLSTGSAEEYPFRDMHASCKEIIAAYGPERCVWGSDFPCELWTPKSTYVQNLRLFTHELGLEPEAKKQILGETAKRLWFSQV